MNIPTFLECLKLVGCIAHYDIDGEIGWGYVTGASQIGNKTTIHIERSEPLYDVFKKVADKWVQLHNIVEIKYDSKNK